MEKNLNKPIKNQSTATVLFYFIFISVLILSTNFQVAIQQLSHHQNHDVKEQLKMILYFLEATKKIISWFSGQFSETQMLEGGGISFYFIKMCPLMI